MPISRTPPIPSSSAHLHSSIMSVWRCGRVDNGTRWHDIVVKGWIQILVLLRDRSEDCIVAQFEDLLSPSPWQRVKVMSFVNAVLKIAEPLLLLTSASGCLSCYCTTSGDNVPWVPYSWWYRTVTPLVVVMAIISMAKWLAQMPCDPGVQVSKPACLHTLIAWRDANVYTMNM